MIATSLETPAGFKKTEVGSIPVDWKVQSIGEAYEIRNQLRLPISRTVRAEMAGPYPYYGPTSVQDWINEYRVEGKYALIGEDGDHFLKWRTQPMTMVVEGKFNVNNHAHLVRGTRNLTEWFAWYFANRDVGAYLTRQGAGRFKLTKAALVQIPMALPPTLAEQEAIAEALGDADALIESLEQLVAKKRHLKQAAMQQLLTGKKRLPGFEGEWDDWTVGDVIQKSFCGPSPTCEERNIRGEEWGVLKTTAMTWQNGWDWTKHKTLPRIYWNQPAIEVRAGDVIVTKAGPRHRVGVTACVDYVPPRILVSGKMIGLRPITTKAAGFMLAAAISAREPQTFLDQRTTGMAESQVNFENTTLLQTPIVLPKIEEQHAIGEILSDMDAEIEAIEAKLAKARQIKQGMMQELLTGRTRLV